MKLERTIIAFLLMSTFSTCAMAEYKSKSVFSADYKCVSETEGGFNHGKTGHKLSLFKGKEEFFLTHISNIPDDVIIKMNKSILKIKSNDTNHIREVLESRIMKQEFPFGDSVDYVTEDSSYFIRTPDIDPKNANTYIFGDKCSSYKEPKNSEIYCYKSEETKVFILDIKTMRFTYSYVGSWHKKRKDGYYGDSSVFAFGTCKKYYR